MKSCVKICCDWYHNVAQQLTTFIFTLVSSCFSSPRTPSYPRPQPPSTPLPAPPVSPPDQSQEGKLVKTSLWNLAIAVVTLMLGYLLLLLPNWFIPPFGFEPTKAPWVRVTGMLFLGLSYMNYTIYWYKEPAWVLRMSIVMRIWAALVFLGMGIIEFSLFFFILAAIFLISVIGGWLRYRSEAA